ncbi:MAG: alpha amylase family protein [Rikenellaceae bacterium]
MKRFLFLITLFTITAITYGQEKPKYMWFDCEANYERLSSKDSIVYYLNKVKSIGFTDVVIDVKSIMGEVLFKSRIAPYMGEWAGSYRSEEFDMLKICIEQGHKLGLKVYASLNVFAGGHNFFNRGIIYKQHPDWQSQVYWQGKIMPIGQMKWNYNGMLNPANPEVRKYQLEILKECAENYNNLDGIILDRMRFDNVTSDFSPQSKAQFEEYSGLKLEKYPEDILYWETVNGKMEWKPGKYFNKWAEWRAMIIKSFAEDVHKELKKINKKIIIGDYTGAWYPTYYQLGVNWASKKYDPSKEFAWATPEYKNSGYADLLDVYMTGLYYTNVTKEDVDKSNEVKGKRGEDAMDNSRSYWYSIEGGSELVKEITCGVVPVVGSILVTQYENDVIQFKRAVSQALKSNEGVMIFDVSHIIDRNWWCQLEDAIKNELTIN